MALNITGKFVKVWKIKEVKEKYTVVDLGTSDKQQDGTYKNSNWFGVKFVGKAHGKEIGDKINILSGKMEAVYSKEKNTTYYNIVVFDFENLEGNASKKKEESEETFPF
ncbi:MAG: hypothetical protein ACRCYT_06795 [Cetobacterium sp.]